MPYLWQHEHQQLGLNMVKTLVIIGSGGFIGSVMRYVVQRAVQEKFMLVFPWGTLTVNVLGSFLIGFIFGLADQGKGPAEDWKMFLTVGICGGFTTFSAFSHENLMLLREGHLLQAFFYTVFSVALGLAAVYFAYFISRLF